MGFMKLEKAYAKYQTEPMKGNIERLMDFDLYHCLLAGSVNSACYVQTRFAGVPNAFMEWMTVCGGGLLFDTVLLSAKGHDSQLDLDFDTFEEQNSEDAYADSALPEGFVIFAMRSCGDPICFNGKENDGKVYLWDVDNAEFSDIWDSFEDWITEEIDDAMQLIAEDALDPLSIKTGGEAGE